MKRLLVGGLMITCLSIPFLDKPQSAHLRSECVEFKNARNIYDEYLIKYEEVQIQKEIQRQIEEQERLRLEELEKQRIEEEANRVVTYNPYNLLEPSNVTEDEVYQMLEGTALQTLSGAYVYMEKIYGVNAIFLMSLSAEESGWGRSSLAISNNNIGGIKSSSGDWAYFNSWGDCLDYKARLLKNQYLSENGDYFNGYSIWNVNLRYCEQLTWSDNISSIAYRILNKINK